MAVMQFDCSNLAAEWDAHDEIRGRLRNKRHLVVSKDKNKDATIVQCVQNMDVLPPLLHRLYACGLKMPEINPLKEQCAETYAKSSRDVGEDVCDDDGWEIRKMLRFIKRKAKREEVSLELRLHLKYYFLLMLVLKIIKNIFHSFSISQSNGVFLCLPAAQRTRAFMSYS